MRRFLLLLSIAGLSCVHGGHLPGGFPQPTRGDALGFPGKMTPPNTKQQALAVVHHAPVKLAEGASAIVVTFNQPMVALAPDARFPATCPIAVKPAVTGRFRWVATDTAKLVLAGSLKNATTYQVTVPTSLASLSGSRLSKPFSWRFESPRPELVNARFFPERTERANRMLVDDQLLLTFNVAVDPQRIANHLQLRANSKQMSVSAVRYEKDPRKVLVRPDRSLPWNVRVELIILTSGPTINTGSTPRDCRC